VKPQSPVLVTFHPETVAFEKNEYYVNELVKALSKIEKQIFITLPNADTNGNIIREKLLSFSRSKPDVHCFESLGTLGYFSAISLCSFMLGNTSSGIIEAASFNKHVINLGDRQKGREHGDNVLNCETRVDSILGYIDQIINTSSNISFKNIYGDGQSSKKVLTLLKKTT
jgi:GDP/UDP-N,N'-diacetylbacillosamine 2-epimerase (hydrolysing)